MNEKKYVYCSGPLFCPEEIGGMTAIARYLEEQGYGTFLPHRDGMEAYVMGLVNSKMNINFMNVRGLIDKAIFALDVYQIVERCDYFVFNMNGRVPDEGGLVETAIAFSAGKPLVIYKNDARTAFNGMDNSMVSGLSGGRKVSDIKKIPAELEKAAKKSAAQGKSRYHDSMPPMMAKTVSFGGKVWKLLSLLNRGEKKPDEFIAEITEISLGYPEIFDNSEM